jgi:hypothetical protein
MRTHIPCHFSFAHDCMPFEPWMMPESNQKCLDPLLFLPSSLRRLIHRERSVQIQFCQCRYRVRRTSRGEFRDPLWILGGARGEGAAVEHYRSRDAPSSAPRYDRGGMSRERSAEFATLGWANLRRVSITRIYLVIMLGNRPSKEPSREEFIHSLTSKCQIRFVARSRWLVIPTICC